MKVFQVMGSVDPNHEFAGPLFLTKPLAEAWVANEVANDPHHPDWRIVEVEVRS